MISIQKVVFGQNYILNNLQFEPFCFLVKSVLLRIEKRLKKGGNLLTILLTITFNKLPCVEHSFFFITSCHWTEEELKTFFGTHFNAKTVLPTPKFQFGGVTGSTVTSIIFSRKSQIVPDENKPSIQIEI